MAAFQIKDAYAVMNALARQATAQNDISVVDHTSFIDAGTKTLSTGTENVLGSIARTIAQVVIQSRPYKGKFGLIAASENQFNTRKAKISFYTSDNEASGAFNTDLNTNIADGQGDADGAGSMWEQKLPKVVERFFLSEAVWDKHYTTPLVQLQNAFNDEGTFVRFMNGVMTEIENDIESTLESRNRSLVADRIAGVYLMNQLGTLSDDTCVDLIKYFNDKCNTTYTREEILSEHLTEFLELWVAKIKIDSDRLEERTTKYHDPMTITENGVDYNILRHTPKSMQKMFYFAELFTEAKSRVLPEIFNPSYLNVDNGEAVGYWQSSKNADRMKIKCKPALPDGAVSQNVELDYVVGILFDTDAIQSINQFTGAYVTPVNARHLFTNTFYHYKFGAIQDYTENSIIYYLGEGGPAKYSETFTGDGTKTEFTLVGEVTSIVSVTVGGEEVSSEDYSYADNVVTFDTAPADKAVIVITYI
jgi:hypothetical protein